MFCNEPQDGNPSERNRSIGMTFVNKLIADEIDMFELYGVYKVEGWWKLKARSYNVNLIKEVINKSTKQTSNAETWHFIWASFTRPMDRGELITLIKQQLTICGIETAIITFLSRERIKCITNETRNFLVQRDQKYPTKYLTNYLSDDYFGAPGFFRNSQNVIENLQLSMGDDLERFEELMKHNQQFDMEKLSFHLSLLTSNEMQKLQCKDPEYLSSFNLGDPDVDAKEFAASESNSKYVFSFCQRYSFCYP